MRRMVFSLFLSMLCLGVSPSWAQTPKIQKEVDKKLEELRAEEKKKTSADPEPVSLDKLIAEALKNNPDVRIAEVRVREAEVTLDRAHLKVVGEISTLHAEIQAAQAAFDEARTRAEVANKLFKHKAIDFEELRTAILTSDKVKHELIGIQGKMPYLLGKQITDPKEKKPASATPEPDSVEKLIAEGLKNNPDVRVAESRLKEAEAVLQQTRMRTAAEITRLQADINAAQASFNEAQVRAQVAKRLYEKKIISPDEDRTSMLTLAKMKRELAVHQAKMPYLLGKQTPKTWVELRSLNLGPGTIHSIDFYEMDNYVRRLNAAVDSLRKLTSSSQGSHPGAVPKDALKLLVDKLDPLMVEKLRRALDKEVALPPDFERRDDKDKVGTLFSMLKEYLPSIVLHKDIRPDASKLSFLGAKDTISMGALVQFLEDDLNLVFIVRDYGIVVMPPSQAPPGAIRVYDFWKLGKTERRP